MMKMEWRRQRSRTARKGRCARPGRWAHRGREGHRPRSLLDFLGPFRPPIATSAGASLPRLSREAAGDATEDCAERTEGRQRPRERRGRPALRCAPTALLAAGDPGSLSKSAGLRVIGAPRRGVREGGACYCPGGYTNSEKFSLSLRSPHRSRSWQRPDGERLFGERTGGLSLLS